VLFTNVSEVSDNTLITLCIAQSRDVQFLSASCREKRGDLCFKPRSSYRTDSLNDVPQLAQSDAHAFVATPVSSDGDSQVQV
jgi:hypothetical protein